MSRLQVAVNSKQSNLRLAVNSKQFRGLLLFACLLLTAYCSLFTAHAQGATVRFETATQTFTVGDAVLLDLVVDHAPGQRVLLPSLEMDWGAIELQGVTQPEITLIENGMERTSIVVQVTAWEPGDYITPPFEVRLASADGTISTLPVQPFPLRVESVLNPDDLNARDIKPQASLPFGTGGSRLVLLGIGALVAVAVVVLAVALRKRRAGSEVVAKITDDRPPHIIALAELDEIEQADLVAAGQFQQHYTRISETIRRYLEREFELTAMEETTYELQRSLRENGILDKGLQKHVIGLLQESDIVKFAKIRPNPTDASQLPEKARQFVNASNAQKRAQEVEPEAEVVA